MVTPTGMNAKAWIFPLQPILTLFSDLDEGSDSAIVTDLAAVEAHEIGMIDGNRPAIRTSDAIMPTSFDLQTGGGVRCA